MKGIPNPMFNQHGIAVSAWVNLDSSCSVEPELFVDELQVEFGSRPSSLRLIIADEMVDRLAEILADAQAHFRKLDEEAEQEEHD